MIELDWGWYSNGGKVPNVDQMMQSAKKLLTEAWHTKATVSTGGFVATYYPSSEYEGNYYDEALGLSFVVEEWTSGD